jgi:hypothetical protein
MSVPKAGDNAGFHSYVEIPFLSWAALLVAPEIGPALARKPEPRPAFVRVT